MASTNMKNRIFAYFQSAYYMKRGDFDNKYGSVIDSMTDGPAAIALDALKKEYTGSYPPPSGSFRKWGQGDRPMLGSRLDWSKGKLFQDQKGRWLAYNPDIEGTMPPTPEESAAQEKLDRSGVRDFAGLGKIIDAVNQQERGRSKDA